MPIRTNESGRTTPDNTTERDSDGLVIKIYMCPDQTPSRGTFYRKYLNECVVSVTKSSDA